MSACSHRGPVQKLVRISGGTQLAKTSAGFVEGSIKAIARKADVRPMSPWLTSNGFGSRSPAREKTIPNDLEEMSISDQTLVFPEVPGPDASSSNIPTL